MFFLGPPSRDVLKSDLVLEDVLKESESKEIQKDVDIKLAKHCIKLETLISKGKKEFYSRFNGNFTMNSPVDDYSLLSILGTGAYGNVFLAKKEGKYYAAKVLEKSTVIKCNQLPHVHNEIRMLDALRFQFMIHLVDFIRTNCYVIMVLPFIRGGEMFEYMKNHGKCDEYQAKFYAAQVILAFEYMHAMGVVYRDLKPENVLIDEVGYIKLVDFGFCKKVDNERTWTLCGTPEYLAPEIILNQGYNRSVDWWSLGIFIFELTAGHPPFCHKDSMKLYENIVSGHFTSPPHFSTHLRDLLSNVIQVDRSKRFGLMKNGSRDFKRHPWFKAIDWNGILDRTVYPPFKPNLKSDDDVSNFQLKPFPALKECEENQYEHEFAVISNKQVEGKSNTLKGLNILKKIQGKKQ